MSPTILLSRITSDSKGMDFILPGGDNSFLVIIHVLSLGLAISRVQRGGNRPPVSACFPVLESTHIWRAQGTCRLKTQKILRMKIYSAPDAKSMRGLSVGDIGTANMQENSLRVNSQTQTKFQRLKTLVINPEKFLLSNKYY